MTFQSITPVSTPEDGVSVTFQLSDAAAIVAAAENLLNPLSEGHAIDAAVLGAAMSEAFGGSDVSDALVWKHAYEAGELEGFDSEVLPRLRCWASSRRSFPGRHGCLCRWASMAQSIVARLLSKYSLASVAA